MNFSTGLCDDQCVMSVHGHNVIGHSIRDISQYRGKRRQVFQFYLKKTNWYVAGKPLGNSAAHFPDYQV